jgi:hypothetical protein
MAAALGSAFQEELNAMLSGMQLHERAALGRIILSESYTLFNALYCGSGAASGPHSTTSCAAVYNREGCGYAPGACGECLIGYIGQEGSVDADCVFAQNASSSSGSSSVSSSLFSTVKQCPNRNCRGPETAVTLAQPNVNPNSVLSAAPRGTCVYLDMTTGQQGLDNAACTAADPNCRAVCRCTSGYTGSGCEFINNPNSFSSTSSGKNSSSSVVDILQIEQNSGAEGLSSLSLSFARDRAQRLLAISTELFFDPRSAVPSTIDTEDRQDGALVFRGPKFSAAGGLYNVSVTLVTDRLTILTQGRETSCSIL